MGRRAAVSLEEIRPQKRFSVDGPNSKTNRTVRNVTNRCFHQEELVLAPLKEGKEVV